MPPRLNSPRTHNTRTSQIPASPTFSTSSPSLSLSSASSSLPTKATVLTSHAITRHQARVSKKARLDFITFSSGIDGTLPISSVSTSSSSSLPASNPTTITSSSQKRASEDTASEYQGNSNNQRLNDDEAQSPSSRTRSKQPRITVVKKSSSSSTISSSSAASRFQTKASGPHQKQIQGIPSFMRQSKNSTSQKRSYSNNRKLSLKSAQDMSSSSTQDLCTGGSQPANTNDQDVAEPDALNCHMDNEVVAAERQANSASSVVPPQADRQTNEDMAEQEENDGEEDEDEDEDEDEEDEDDEEGLFSSGGNMSGMVSGISSRLKGILSNLRAYQDPSLQLIALQDLAVLLSVSTEETLQGYFSTDSFVKELVLLMRGNGDGDDNPEIMLLACRCLSNLMEAMPGSLGNVVHGGAVPVLCAKLIEIQYIDVAEQSLTTLEKISSEYPHTVVKEGGLAAVLMFLDFFSTNVQRTAVKTAANCCRGIQHDSVSMVQDILPNLESILQYSDQKIVEQACLCFVRLADSYKSSAVHLQTIITESILRAVLSLLSPNANVVVGTVAEHSPTLGFALLEMDIIDTLYLVLTGTHAPNTDSENEDPLLVPDIGSRSKEQVSEVIGIITELLPSLPKDDALFDTEYRYLALKKDEKNKENQDVQEDDVDMANTSASIEIDKREELLKSHPERIRRMGKVMIPTLIEVYSSTVHLRVRQRAIHALVKLIYYTPDDVLKGVLKNVELASFLAIVLSQQEHQSLVAATLQISTLLMMKLPSVYRFFFEREGVTFEISKLAYLGAELSLAKEAKCTNTMVEDSTKITNSDNQEIVKATTTETDQNILAKDNIFNGASNSGIDERSDANSHESHTIASTNNQRLIDLITELRGMRTQQDQKGTIDEQLDAIGRELEAAWGQYMLSRPSDGENGAQGPDSRLSALEHVRTLQRLITGGSRSVITAQKEEKGLGSGKAKEWIFERARIFIELFQRTGSLPDDGIYKGTSVLSDLKRMATELRESRGLASNTIKELSKYFVRLGSTGISSFEFLNSGLPQALLSYLANPKRAGFSSQDEKMRNFVEHFMNTPCKETGTSAATSPFILLVKKMQEALTRMETFEVEVAQSSLGEVRNNSSSSLATQVRLKLSPDEGTEVPSGYQNLVVSIHAIATFRTLDEYLRPRLKPRLSSTDTKYNDGSKNGSSQSRVTGINPKESTPRRSSRLQKLASKGSEEKVTDNTDAQPSPVKRPVDAGGSSPDDSYEDSEGDVEEMEYDLERRGSVQSSKGVESSTIDFESDVKMADMSKTNISSGASETDNCLQKTENANLPKKEKSSHNSSQESSSPWYIQFSLYGNPINTDMTVYGAIHEYERKNGRNASQRSMWSSMYPIKYRRVDSSPPEQLALAANTQSPEDTDLTFTAQMPKELPQQAEYGPILGLLRILHGLNNDWRRFFGSDDQLPITPVQRLPNREFVNSKITAKVNRQLEEPLIVASSCLPDWTVGLVKGFPFLFPFETRYTYLQSTAFGFSRSIMRWQTQQQRNGHTDHRDDSQTFLGRIQRQKVRISRQKALESAVRVMDLYGASQAMLEVEFFDEVGTGLGPTLEFYSLVSKEFCKKSLKLWRDADSESLTEYVSAPQGLFPRPMAYHRTDSDDEKKILKLFRSLGQFIAKAMLDSRIIDVPLSPLFVNQLLGHNLKTHLQLVSLIDPVLARSLESLHAFVTEKKRIYGMKLPSKEREVALKNIKLHGTKLEDMSLDFTLAGYPHIELKTGGASVPVTIYNVEEYIRLTVDMTVGRGVEAQLSAFRAGFNSVFSIQDLAGFTSEELVNLFGLGEEDWSYETLVDTVKADHGFRSESRAFKNLLTIMSEFNNQERRQFLQFITGSPKLPIGGFKNLHPPFTVVCKPFEAPLKADDYLPSVMTCANYLKMPDYSCKEVTLAKFKMAYEEGQGSFHLS
ncbi:Ubiquitin fusion degradation protein 4 [Lobosporangium transversale]|nr:Ubiquitin fusion degradation protein 4 [Lobosporangium transversale]